MADEATMMEARLREMVGLLKMANARNDLLVAMIHDLLPFVEEPWTSFSGRLFGVGGGAVLRARELVGLARVLKAGPKRNASLDAPRHGQFAPGDLFTVSGFVVKLRKITGRSLTMKIIGGVPQ